MTEFRPYRFPRARFTKLTSCGIPSTAACAMWAISGVIELSMTPEVLEMEQQVLQDGDGNIIDTAVVEKQLKWFNVELSLTGIEPQIVNWLTGNTVLLNDATPAVPVGFADEVTGAPTVNVALEGWQRLLGQSCAGGNPLYGYWLLPWLTGGHVAEVKVNKQLLDFKVTGLRALINSPWGVGPYAVTKSAAAATLGHPWPLYTAVGAQQPRLLEKTELAPPLVMANCDLVTGPLTVIDTDAGGPLLGATATLPTGTGILPCTIDWGDLTITHVTVGPTATHTYALAGAYTVTLTPDSQSGPHYVGTVTVA